MTTRLLVDRSACAGHGLCYGAAPEILDSDDQGDPVVIMDPVPKELQSLARDAARSCPERALTLHSSTVDDQDQSRR